MAMFSFDKTSYESRLLQLLQDKFFMTARRNKILAKWAGGRLGYTENRLNRYVRSIIFSYLMLPNDRRLVNRILSDFLKARIDMSENIIRQKMRTIEMRIKSRKRNADKFANK